MIFLRSLAFHICFFLSTGFWCLRLYSRLRGTKVHLVRGVVAYKKNVEWLEKNILGLHHSITGLEHLPKGPAILALKHQSAWETMKLALWVQDPAIIMKKELMRIPLWGDFARALGSIPVDRGGGSKVMEHLIEEAQKAKADGRIICIFPQGTRLLPGVKKPYKMGAPMLAHALNLPLIPVALNSGIFWPRGAFLIKGGTIRVEILPPLELGATPAETRTRLENILEAASDKLL